MKRVFGFQIAEKYGIQITVSRMTKAATLPNIFHSRCIWGSMEFNFSLGVSFTTMKVLREALNHYAVTQSFPADNDYQLPLIYIYIELLPSTTPRERRQSKRKADNIFPNNWRQPNVDIQGQWLVWLLAQIIAGRLYAGLSQSQWIRVSRNM